MMSKSKEKKTGERLQMPSAKRNEEFRIASWNVNGLRSVLGKGLLTWLKEGDFDVVLFQEIKAKPTDFGEIEPFYKTAGFEYANWATAEKNGYSGLLTLSKIEPTRIQVGLGVPEIDREGRWLEVDLGKYTFVNSYFPNSQRDHARLGYKLEFCKYAQDRLNLLAAQDKLPILAGDINVAHTEIDLANPKSNKNNAGFLPEERNWMTSLLSSGWVDAFRRFESSGGHYTWWSYRPGVREKNIGWRLDHFFISQRDELLLNWMKHQSDVFGSDHCPIVLSVRREPSP